MRTGKKKEGSSRRADINRSLSPRERERCGGGTGKGEVLRWRPRCKAGLIDEEKAKESVLNNIPKRNKLEENRQAHWPVNFRLFRMGADHRA